jgi:hypothetical protein
MSSNRRQLIEANLDFQSLFELKRSGHCDPAVSREHGHGDPGSNVIGSNVIGSDSGSAQKGIACRVCGCRHLRCLETRQAPGGRVKRRKACRHCGHRLTTFEKPYGS